MTEWGEKVSNTDKLPIELSLLNYLYLKHFWFYMGIRLAIMRCDFIYSHITEKITFVDCEIRAFPINVYFIATVRCKQS